ncbi:MAG: hydrolase [Rhodospirillaceae bacterium]|jgi:isochorismate hydrolase|nr:hydrolase [Rhodospirillaceae bacterium]MBT5245914.1 hydrolase [Rhodospirillaceae bacterium]MBT5561839.1 hydrolase [Rhodospirillaceae bacterium]MBT6240953.1 hydrolase [Rhodospirillaceae bacterium]MBT7138132.1 hydrolase [Rhodospirillaceae bacterium]
MLIKADRSALLVIDIQDKLAPAMNNIEGVVENTSILMRAASRLKVPQLVSEQYPQGLGATIEPLAELGIGEVVAKVTFSCMADADYGPRFKALGRAQAVIVGVEAHVCVLQTAMDLLEQNVQVFVVADATTSRSPDNHSMGLHRLSGAGAEIVTTEMVLFEWLGQAGTPEFKDISKFIK